MLYAGTVLVVLAPIAVLLSGAAENSRWSTLLRAVHDTYAEGLTWFLIATILLSKVLLLSLSVDTTQKRLKPKTQIWVLCAVTGALTAMMAGGIYLSVGVALRGEQFLTYLDSPGLTQVDVVLLFAGIWLVWGIAVYIYFRDKSDATNRVISWLLKGSVLELLIAVPCHVIIRRKEHCCAPVVTSFGIVTGAAVMLLSFGPSVLFLYKKRLDGYRRKQGPAEIQLTQGFAGRLGWRQSGPGLNKSERNPPPLGAGSSEKRLYC